MLYMLAIACIVACFCFARLALRSTRLLELAAFSISLFFCLYVVASGLLFWADVFTFERALALVLAASGALIACRLWQCRGEVSVGDRLKADLLAPVAVDVPLLIILLVTLVLTVGKFGLYSPGQDQGNYQAEAVAIAKGDYHAVHNFEEYESLSTSEPRIAYRNMIHGWVGYYPLLKDIKYPTVNESDVENLLTGVFHGVITWPAIMALFGALFGIPNMFQVQTVFILCAVIFLYYTMRDLGVMKKTAIGCTLIFVGSPLIIWVSKTSFTEVFLTLLMAMYAWILCNKRASKALLSAPLAAFAYFHVSFLMLVPMFFIVQLVAYTESNDKGYLVSSIVMAAALASGYEMMACTAAHYFFFNIKRIYFGLINANTILGCICVGAVLITVLCFIANCTKVRQVLQKALRWKRLPYLLTAIMALCIAAMILYGIHIGWQLVPSDGWWSDQTIYYGTGIAAFSHLTLYAFSMATGWIIVPITLFGLVWQKWFIEPGQKGLQVFLLCLMYLYAVIFQAAFIRKEIYHYYYYSRYLAFYIPLICTVAALVMDGCKAPLFYGAVCVSLASMTVFDCAVISSGDDTMWSWNSLQGVDEAIKGNAAVVFASPESSSTMGPFARWYCGADIYPTFDDIQTELEWLSKRYSHVYYLTTDPASVDLGFDGPTAFIDNRLNAVYRDHYIYSVGGDDARDGTFPIDFSPKERELALYEYAKSSEIKLKVNSGRVGRSYVSEGKGYVESLGNEGMILYGPYLSLTSGVYELEMPYEVLKASNGTAVVSIAKWDAASGSFVIYGETELVASSNRQVAALDFVMPENTSDIEITVTESPGACVRIYDYSVRKMN